MRRVLKFVRESSERVCFCLHNFVSPSQLDCVGSGAPGIPET